MKPPKIKFRDGVHRFNLKDNLFDITNIDDAVELFSISIEQLKEKRDKYSRCFCLNTIMSLQLGNFITFEYFCEILSYLNLSLDEFESFVGYQYSRFYQLSHIEFRWYWGLKLGRVIPPEEFNHKKLNDFIDKMQKEIGN